jgi:outer membrane biosynthesis protein TonB
METKSAIIGGLSALAAVGIAFGGFAVANADTQPAPAPSAVVTTVTPAPVQEPAPAVVTPAPEPSTIPAAVPAAPAPAPVQEPVYVAEEPAPAPVYVAPEPAPVAPAPAPVAVAPAPAGEYNQVQLAPVNGTSATAYSTDPNAPVNAPTIMPGNGKRG